MHVIIINYNGFQRFETLENLMAYYFPLIGWAKGLMEAGVKVTVFQRFRENLVIKQEGVPIHLITDPGPDVTPYQLPWPLHQQVVRLCQENIGRGQATAVHLNGLLYPLQTRWLRSQLPRQVPIVVQHHGSRPWANGFRRSIQRVGLRGADRFMFAAADLAEEWIEAGIISERGKVYEIMESSAIFRFEERPLARAKTNMYGSPVIFWAGNLDENKDPITILNGFKLFLKEQPEARLYMAFRGTMLLKQVETFLAKNRPLAQAVTLLGTIAHERLADYYNSADLFVQGSRKEGSGLALLECLACGVIPVVTDIPAFRALTGNGQVGALWPVGNATVLAQKLLAMLERPIADQSQAARDYFEANWTFEAIGRRASVIYRQAIDLRALRSG